MADHSYKDHLRSHNLSHWSTKDAAVLLRRGYDRHGPGEVPAGIFHLVDDQDRPIVLHRQVGPDVEVLGTRFRFRAGSAYRLAYTGKLLFVE